MCPFCPYVGSVLARESRPGRGGLAKNGRDRAVSDLGPPPRSLDQWSIPSASLLLRAWGGPADAVTQRDFAGLKVKGVHGDR